jgi:hypothetical protein
MNTHEFKSKEGLLFTAISALVIVIVVVIDSLLIKVPSTIFVCLASLVTYLFVRSAANTFKTA